MHIGLENSGNQESILPLRKMEIFLRKLEVKKISSLKFKKVRVVATLHHR